MTRARDVANIDGLLTTTGDTYYASAAGTPARLGIGSTDQVLKVSGGVPTWATPAAAASGLTLITRQTFSAVASADIDNVFTSTYETYQIVIEECFSSVDSDLQMQWRYAGPNTQSASYYGKIASLNTTYSALDTSNGTKSTINQDIRTGTGQASNSTFWVNQVGNGSRNPIAYGLGAACSFIIPTVFNSYNATARVYTGFRLVADTGNLTANVAVYGLAKS